MAGAGKMSGGGNYVTDSFTDIIVPSNLDLGKIFLLIVANLLWKLVCRNSRMFPDSKLELMVSECLLGS